MNKVIIDKREEEGRTYYEIATERMGIWVTDEIADTLQDAQRIAREIEKCL